jgi:uncharacterized protein YkwD
MSRSRLAVVLAIAIGAFPSAAVAPAGGNDPPMVDRINKARTKRGLPPLRHHAGLSRSARRYARHLMRTDAFGHAGRIRASHRFRRLGELLAKHRGRRPRPGRAVKGWLRSAGHRPVLLSRAFRFVGAGRVYGWFRGRRCTIWVVQLGAR